jgi:hypothetical protein
MKAKRTSGDFECFGGWPPGPHPNRAFSGGQIDVRSSIGGEARPVVHIEQ